MMYLRHEAGHCFNYAYRLYETEEWRKLFGDYHKPYKEDYKPQPFSREYVAHISGWYAQKHPDEDFAETFAVWLTPGLDWRQRYRSWGAPEEAPVRGRHRRPSWATGRPGRARRARHRRRPDGRDGRRPLPAARPGREGRPRDRRAARHDLFQLFEPPGSAPASAAQMLRAERQTLIQAVTQYSGVNRAVVRSVVDHLTERTEQLKLTVTPDRASGYVAKLRLAGHRAGDELPLHRPVLRHRVAESHRAA